jgi:hypothetical protein
MVRSLETWDGRELLAKLGSTRRRLATEHDEYIVLPISEGQSGRGLRECVPANARWHRPP